MKPILFTTTLIAELLTTLAVVVSIVSPQRRIWPPAPRRAWTGYVMWALFIISGLGVIATGVLDWNHLSFAPWLRWGIGLPLWLGGMAFAQWAVIILGMARSFGDTGGLIRHGPYRWSRNPQYVGFIASLLGWGLVAASSLTLVLALAGSLPLIFVPFAEEPWLAMMYSAAYENYKQAVPRFIIIKRNTTLRK